MPRKPCKWQRGYEHAVTVLGSDHHGTLARVKAGLQALDAGIPKDWPEYVLYQMVTVIRGGEEVKISKRAGSYVTLRDLIDEAGCDATRYVLIARKTDSQLIFDIDLARSQSNDNPVYYIQYAHARVCAHASCSQAARRGFTFDRPARRPLRLGRLDNEHEQILLTEREMPSGRSAPPPCLPSPHAAAACHRTHARIAADAYYNSHQFLVDDVALRNGTHAPARDARRKSRAPRRCAVGQCGHGTGIKGGRNAVRNTSGGFPGWAYAVIGILVGAIMMAVVMRGSLFNSAAKVDGPQANSQATAEHGSDPGVVEPPAADTAPKISRSARCALGAHEKKPRPARHAERDRAAAPPKPRTSSSSAPSPPRRRRRRHRRMRRVAAQSIAQRANARRPPCGAWPTITAPTSIGPANPAPTPAAGSGYLLQVGAFPNPSDAESLKAKLAMQGFVASVQSVTVSGQPYHRVRLGPFRSATELESTKKRLAAPRRVAIACVKAQRHAKPAARRD
ncbi:MAG: hypothetical protein WDW36_003386 [Sanguina aurantia]